MAKDKTQRHKVKTKIGISYAVRPISRTKRVLRIIAIFATSATAMILILFVSQSVLKLFPEYVSISTANDLLRIIIETDGILVGFIGVTFAQQFSSILEQQNVLYQSALDKGDKTADKKKSIDFLDFRRNGLAVVAAFTFIFLLLSIFLSILFIAQNSKFLPTDTYQTSWLLFGPLLLLMIAVLLLMLAFVALPMRPPLEKIIK